MVLIASLCTLLPLGVHLLDDDRVRDQFLQVVDVRGEDGDLSSLLSRNGGEHRVDRVLVAMELGVGQKAAGPAGLFLSDVGDLEPGEHPVPPLCPVVLPSYASTRVIGDVTTSAAPWAARLSQASIFRSPRTARDPQDDLEAPGLFDRFAPKSPCRSVP
jgi:hypothetical protein